jgi:hypothetical protein
MELNDLKQNWNKTTQSQSPLKNNIMNIIKSKSNGPTSILESKFKKQLWALIALPVLIAVQFYRTPQMLNNPAIWFLYLLGFISGFYILYNYLIVKKLQHPQFAVKENIETQVTKLENSFRIFRIFMLLVYILVPVGLELAIKYNLQTGFEQWYGVSLPIRILVYVGGLIAMYFLSRRWFQSTYSGLLSNLKSLAEQL